MVLDIIYSAKFFKIFEMCYFLEHYLQFARRVFGVVCMRWGSLLSVFRVT